VALAGRAAAVPRDLMDRVHATVREAAWHADFETAIAVELERQAWSFGRGYFNERLRRR